MTPEATSAADLTSVPSESSRKLNPLPRYIRRAMLKAALLQGREPWQAGYDEGFSAGQAHGFRLGYAQAKHDLAQERLTEKEPVNTTIANPAEVNLIQPVHGVLAPSERLRA